MRHSSPGKECKKPFDIKRYSEKLYTELVSFAIQNGIFTPGRITSLNLPACPLAIQRQANTAGIKHKFVSVTEEELLMRMSTNQNLCRCVGEEFVQLLRWGSGKNSLHKRPGRAMIGKECPLLTERPFNRWLKGAYKRFVFFGELL